MLGVDCGMVKRRKGSVFFRNGEYSERLAPMGSGAAGGTARPLFILGDEPGRNDLHHGGGSHL